MRSYSKPRYLKGATRVRRSHTGYAACGGIPGPRNTFRSTRSETFQTNNLMWKLRTARPATETAVTHQITQALMQSVAHGTHKGKENIGRGYTSKDTLCRRFQVRETVHLYRFNTAERIFLCANVFMADWTRWGTSKINAAAGSLNVISTHSAGVGIWTILR